MNRLSWLHFGACFFIVFSAVSQDKTPAYYFDITTGKYLTESGEPVQRCSFLDMHEHRIRHEQERGNHIRTDEQFEEWLRAEIHAMKMSRSYTGVIRIPVVVHVVHNGDAYGTGENITDEQVLSQIEVLNEDFRRMFGTPGYNTHPDGADTEIEFVMAKRAPDGSPTNGINRHDGGVASWSTAAIESTLKPTTIWDPTQYMNMWTVRFTSTSLLGYAQFPDGSGLAGMPCSGGSASTDGLVMGYQFFGSSDKGTGFALSAPFDKGRTATHEIGHGLGLRHIWGDGGCAADDFCTDTPFASAANYGCSANTSCGSADMIENYMDYTDDECMNIFTLEQKERMRAVLLSSDRRLSLLNSPALLDPEPDNVAIDAIISPANELCSGGTTTPQIRLKNLGSNTLTSARIAMYVDEVFHSNNDWAGSLAPAASTPFDLNEITVALGVHELRVEVVLANGLSDTEETDNVQSTTFAYTSGQTLPFGEDFSGNEFPPQYWNVNNVGDDCLTWNIQQVVQADGTVGGAAIMNHYEYPTTGQLDYLETPLIDLTGKSNITLTFHVAYARYNNTTSEALRVYVSTDCGETYSTALFNKSGATLATVSNTTTDWRPTASGNWRSESVNLNAYAGEKIIVRFESVNDYGNNMYIDNIAVLDQQPLIQFVSASQTVTESTAAGSSCREYTDVNIPLRITAAPTGDAEVTVSVGSETANNPADYEIVSAMPIVFPNGNTSNRNLTVRVYNDDAVESRENIKFQFSVSGTTNAGLHPNNQEYTLNIEDNNPDATGAGEVVLFSSDFENGRGDWVNYSTGTSGNNIWYVGSAGAISGTQSAFVGQSSSNANYDFNSTSATLIGHKIDARGVNATMALSFLYQCNGEISGMNYRDYGRVFYSLDLSSTTQIGSNLTGQSSNTAFSQNLASALQNSIFYILFRWDNNNNGSGGNPAFRLDNVKISYQGSATVASTLNRTASAYLGPNDLVYFYDDSNGELIAKIQNMSDHDYGCTIVTVDRSGSEAKEFWNSGIDKMLADKTVLVTPEFNNPYGEFEITLYYQESEIAGWETATGKSRNVMTLAKTSGNVSNITPDTPEANGAGNVLGENPTRAVFGEAYAIGAQFSTGFSGFGAGDPGLPESNPLPLELISFTVNVRDHDAILEWKSASEVNTDVAEIQHARENGEFATIGTRKLAGNSSGELVYQFVHENISYGKHFYRLRFVDVDGSFEYSPVRHAFQSRSGFEIISITPNPSSGRVELVYQSDEEGPIQFELTNVAGQKVKSAKWNSTHGINTMRFDFSGIDQGMFIVSLTSRGRKEQYKLVLLGE
jgi:hypothetical protein